MPPKYLPHGPLLLPLLTSLILGDAAAAATFLPLVVPRVPLLLLLLGLPLAVIVVLLLRQHPLLPPQLPAGVVLTSTTFAAALSATLSGLLAEQLLAPFFSLGWLPLTVIGAGLLGYFYGDGLLEARRQERRSTAQAEPTCCLMCAAPLEAAKQQFCPACSRAIRHNIQAWSNATKAQKTEKPAVAITIVHIRQQRRREQQD